MRRAAVTGRLDFSKAQPQDRHWQLRLDWTLDEIENESLNQLAAHRLALYEAAVIVAAGTPRLESYWSAIGKLHGRIAQRMLPWKAAEAAQQRAEQEHRFAAKWAELWGDPESEEGKAAIAATVAALERRAKGRP